MSMLWLWTWYVFSLISSFCCFALGDTEFRIGVIGERYSGGRRVEGSGSKKKTFEKKIKLDNIEWKIKHRHAKSNDKDKDRKKEKKFIEG